ncbi:EAL domain-containing protein [Candidatus Venteria ishoeyi]|uniref:EAL domain-containing protein n=1 Tax=Candidatus Venteria ishoeyi TaxID=1899563 RepID=UPI0025A60282|nr:EAL domain-containing protein [Candidatus Venteria ishoeyi]MDM8547654.1 EAL domain-containing protein [Candidatus Venteria ishoeyi]
MLNLSKYQIIEQLYEGINSLVYRAIRKQDKYPVILKILKQDYPDPAALSRYKQEYKVIHNLNVEGAIKAYAIEKYKNTLFIALEDIGGLSLKRLAGNHPVSIKDFLSVAIKIADSLGHLHAANIIHKDINPSNIVLNPKTGELKIIDFGISSYLLREIPNLKNPDKLEATLAYCSPEQSGRINRSLDYRSDLYSLGITFYELVTGKLPFLTTDSMGLLHCHIAKKIPPVSNINSDIPQIISEIITKLLEKNAEDRYQSAFGVKSDLENCQFQLNNYSHIEPFSLASHDFSVKLQIPQKLYGRDKEAKILLDTFERACLGTTEIILVTGYSGVGKTALVHEIHKPMTEKRGYFAAGKFDQFQKNIPYSAITQAFNEFCRYLLMENTQILLDLKVKILEALGNNGQVIIDVIPDLELIIGPQPAVAKVSPAEAKNHFKLIFLNFIKSLCHKQQPFILFIDDLQWVDSASLGLLKSIMLDNELQYLLIIGAYRDNEVNANHPLIINLNELQQDNIIINYIKLDNLKKTDINNLLQDSLKCDLMQSHELTNLIYQKTQGNAFFTHQFLYTLYTEKLLYFDYKQHQWQWNVEQIASQNITANVVDLMANKIKKLADKVSTLLQLAACIGNQFDLSMLAIISEKNQTKTLSTLRPAIIEGLIQPLDENYRFFDGTKKTQFKFLHDRVQQAAYILIDKNQKQLVHLKIGRLLLANISQTEVEEYIFDIVNQLNKGQQLIDNTKEKQNLAELNFKAGKKAKLSVAYEPALHYLLAATELLPLQAWEKDYRFSFDLNMTIAECYYLLGNTEKTNLMIASLLDKSSTATDTVKVHILNALKLHNEGDFPTALEADITALKLLGVEIPVKEKELENQLTLKINKLKILLQTVKATDWADLPLMENVKIKLIMQILDGASTMAYDIGNKKIHEFLVLNMLELTIRFGNTDESAQGVIYYAMLHISKYENYEQGFLFDKRAKELISRFNNKSIEAQINYWHGGLFNHWVNPLKTNVDVYKLTYQLSIESGNVVYAPFSLTMLNYSRLSSGENLSDVKQEINKAIIQVEKLKNKFVTGLLNIALRFIDTLTTSEKTTNIETFFNKKIIQDKYLDNIVYKFWYIFWKCQVLYHLDEFDVAFKQLEKHIALATTAFTGLFPAPIYIHYYLLSLTAIYPSLSTLDKKSALEKINSFQQQFKFWSKNCPENFLHQYLLVEAEKSRITGDEMEAVILYDKAIQAAREGAMIQYEALANELVAKFWLTKNKPDFAQLHLKKAHYLYSIWGAAAKVLKLEKEYPKLLITKTSLSSNNSMIKTVMSSTEIQRGNSAQLDFSSLIKASQMLSEEIILRKLLANMMNIVIENAGAEKGLLLLPKKNSWFIEAEKYIDSNEVTVLQSLAVKDSGKVPESLLYYVIRTRESVVLANAAQQGNFMQDAYVIKYKSKSILVLALNSQSKLTGILYLENNLIEGAFTPERLEVLSLLASQITISIENSLLYSHLKEQKDILDYKSHYDDLTGLPNREFFLDRLSQSVKSAQRTGKTVAVIFIDLDRFKEINDSFGYQFGDSVLKIVSARLQQSIRKTDTVSHLGGDEFTLILDSLHSSNEVVDIIQHMIEAMNKPIRINGNLLYLTLSIGISLYPDDGKEPNILLKNADAAMYKAKDEGRNTYRFYTQEMTNKALERIVLETSLHQALDNEEFTVYYQPQVDGENGLLLGMEALIRWQHKIMGMVSPDKFIPLAEETGLIIPLDQWTMRTAMKQIVNWYAQGLNPGVLALNLAIKQLQHKDFITMLSTMLTETGCKPEWIGLEVTEGQIMLNPEKAITILDKISNMGIELSVDDFGTGYSSLSYLKKLPIDKLKIDQSFVRHLPDDEDDIAITKSIIALSKNLNLKVIAEGVETDMQKTFLVKNGCRAIQGYFYSKPIPADEMEIYIQKHDMVSCGHQSVR